MVSLHQRNRKTFLAFPYILCLLFHTVGCSRETQNTTISDVQCFAICYNEFEGTLSSSGGIWYNFWGVQKEEEGSNLSFGWKNGVWCVCVSVWGVCHCHPSEGEALKRASLFCDNCVWAPTANLRALGKEQMRPRSATQPAQDNGHFCTLINKCIQNTTLYIHLPFWIPFHLISSSLRWAPIREDLFHFHEMFIFSGKFLSHLLKFYGAWRSAGYRVLLRKLVRFKRDHKFQILWVRIMEVHQDLNLTGSIQTCVGFFPPHSSPFFSSAIKFKLKRKKGGGGKIPAV